MNYVIQLIHTVLTYYDDNPDAVCAGCRGRFIHHDDCPFIQQETHS